MPDPFFENTGIIDPLTGQPRNSFGGLPAFSGGPTSAGRSWQDQLDDLLKMLSSPMGFGTTSAEMMARSNAGEDPGIAYQVLARANDVVGPVAGLMARSDNKSDEFKMMQDELEKARVEYLAHGNPTLRATTEFVGPIAANTAAAYTPAAGLSKYVSALEEIKAVATTPMARAAVGAIASSVENAIQGYGMSAGQTPMQQALQTGMGAGLGAIGGAGGMIDQTPWAKNLDNLLKDKVPALGRLFEAPGVPKLPEPIDPIVDSAHQMLKDDFEPPMKFGSDEHVNTLIHAIGEADKDPIRAAVAKKELQRIHDKQFIEDNFGYKPPNDLEKQRTINKIREQPPLFEPSDLTATIAEPVRLANKDFDGQEGNKQHITRNSNGVMSTSKVLSLVGERGEVRGEHRNKIGPDWEAFKEDIRQNGIKDPIFITVDPGVGPRISEGNHRLDAAIELGLKDIPVEIRYYGHSERQFGADLSNTIAEPVRPSKELNRIQADPTRVDRMIALRKRHPNMSLRQAANVVDGRIEPYPLQQNASLNPTIAEPVRPGKTLPFDNARRLDELANDPNVSDATWAEAAKGFDQSNPADILQEKADAMDNSTAAWSEAAIARALDDSTDYLDFKAKMDAAKPSLKLIGSIPTKPSAKPTVKFSKENTADLQLTPLTKEDFPEAEMVLPNKNYLMAKFDSYRHYLAGMFTSQGTLPQQATGSSKAKGLGPYQLKKTFADKGVQEVVGSVWGIHEAAMGRKEAMTYQLAVAKNSFTHDVKSFIRDTKSKTGQKLDYTSIQRVITKAIDEHSLDSLPPELKLAAEKYHGVLEGISDQVERNAPADIAKRIRANKKTYIHRMYAVESEAPNDLSAALLKRNDPEKYAEAREVLADMFPTKDPDDVIASYLSKYAALPDRVGRAHALPRAGEESLKSRMLDFGKRFWGSFDEAQAAAKEAGGDLSLQDHFVAFTNKLNESQSPRMKGAYKRVSTRFQELVEKKALGGKSVSDADIKNAIRISIEDEDMPPALRRLLGEQDQADLAMAITGHKMAHDLVMYDMWQDIDRKFLAAGIFSHEQDSVRNVQVDSEHLRGMSGPSGEEKGSARWAAPDTAAFLASIKDTDRFTAMEEVMGIVKLGKVLTLQSFMRNLGSVVPMMIQNNHMGTVLASPLHSIANALDVRPFGLGKKYATMGAVLDSARLAGRTARTTIHAGQTFDPEVAKMFGLNLAHGGGSEEQRLLASAMSERFVDPSSKMAFKGARSVVGAVKTASDIYATPDVFAKTLGTKLEAMRLAKNRGLETISDDLLREAASNVKDMYQHYPRTARIVQKVSRSPVLGTFAAFGIEMMRNTKNIAVKGLSEIRQGANTGNAHSIASGVGRIGGIVANYAMFAALGKMADQELGVTDKMREAFGRLHARPEDANSTPLFANRDGDTWTYYNTGNQNPYEIQQKVINGMMQPGTLEEKAYRVAKDLAISIQPVPLLPKAAIEGWTGGTVGNDWTDPQTRFQPARRGDEGLSPHKFIRGVAPSAYNTLDKFVTQPVPEGSSLEHEVWRELESQATGWRLLKSDTGVELRKRASRFVDKRDYISSDLTNALLKIPYTDLEGRKKLFDTYEEQWKKHYTEMMYNVQDAKILERSNANIWQDLKRLNVSNTMAGMLIEGQYMSLRTYYAIKEYNKR